MKLSIFGTLTIFLLANYSYSSTITSLSLVEKEGITTYNYPLTFGHVFKMGDVTKGVIIEHESSNLTTQFDIKNRWPDGSVKYGIISIVIPKVDAQKTEYLTIKSSSTSPSSDSMLLNDIVNTNIDSTISLKNISGSGYSGSLTASLRDSLTSGKLNYWLQGPVCTEIIEKQQLNNSLNVLWEARFYPGTSFGIRISNSIENVNVLYRGNVLYDVSIDIGHHSPMVVYTKKGFTHLHESRWRKIFWLGEQPPETELHFDVNYWISTGAIPAYDTNITVDSTIVEKEYQAWQNSNHDIDGNGLITYAFGATGSRREISPLPRWSAMYLLSMDNRMKELVIGHGEIAGTIPRIHSREGDSTKTNLGGVTTIDDRTTLDQIEDWGGGIPPAIGSIDTGLWKPDRAHHGSFSYLPYLITGDYWLMWEVRYWGAYVLAFDNYKRSGGGTTQDFSEGKDASEGIFYDQLRGVAWSLRTLSDAAFITPDSYPLERAYFGEKLQNNIDWLIKANQTSSASQGVHAIRIPRDQQSSATPWIWAVSPWQHDYTLTSLRHILDQQSADETKVKKLITYLGYFTVGRFTNHPAFNKWDGAGYWWCLAEKGGKSFFKEGDWANYWAAVLERDSSFSSQGLPHSDYTRYNYADSYLAVAIATLNMLPDTIDGVSEARSFTQDNLNRTLYTRNPQWAITHTHTLNNSDTGTPIIKSISQQ